MHNIETCNSINDDGETVGYFAFISSTVKKDTEIFVKHCPTRIEAEHEAKSICKKLGFEVGAIDSATVKQDDSDENEPF